MAEELEKSTQLAMENPSGSSSSAPAPTENRVAFAVEADAHAIPCSTLIQRLSGNASDGLTTTEAANRLALNGRNEIGDGPKSPSIFIIFFHQVCNAMTLVLLVVTAISFYIQSYAEGAVIVFIVILNIGLGVYQEWGAEKSMAALRGLSAPTANVVRDGHNKVISAKEVVKGDMIELVTGDRVAADIRLIEAVNCEIDESILTGESVPVSKVADQVFPVPTVVADRLNLAYASTTITKGRARGIVFATGNDTEMGSISKQLNSTTTNQRPKRLSRHGSMASNSTDGHAVMEFQPEHRISKTRYALHWLQWAWYPIGKFLGTNVGSPLQRKLGWLWIYLFWGAVICLVIVFGANYWMNDREVIIYAIATAISNLPAALPVVLTLTRTKGIAIMSRRNVIVRKAAALESLGSVTDICSDKTGTITQGKMMLSRAWVPSSIKGSTGTWVIDTEDPFDPENGTVKFVPLPPSEMENSLEGEKSSSMPASQAPSADNNTHFRTFLDTASLCNLAHVHRNADSSATKDSPEEKWIARGDPTEIAIQVFASRFDWNRARLTDENSDEDQKFDNWNFIDEFPFDSDVKRMSVVYSTELDGVIEQRAFTKGAVERILDRCTTWNTEQGTETGKSRRMTDEDRAYIMAQMEALSNLGLRTLALASRKLTYQETKEVETSGDGNENKRKFRMTVDRDTVESNLTFYGLVGIYDPPRAESILAVKECNEAGIEVHMLTGDHLATATAIAKEVGILPTDSEQQHMSKDVVDAMVFSADKFDALSDDQIDRLPNLPRVIARCAPSTKVRMIEALHRRNRVAAMTGDGVNDSPALKRADVGIAMGSGSDVAKEAAELVLSDDNFASIVAAVEIGRRVFINIQRFVLHLLAQNVALTLVLLIGLSFKDESKLSIFPLTPVQIMFILMAASSFPAIGLGYEAADPNNMKRLPQAFKSIFPMELIVDIFIYGLCIATIDIVTFVVLLWGLGNGITPTAIMCNETYSAGCQNVFEARAATFLVMTWCSTLLAWQTLGDLRLSIFQLGSDGKETGGSGKKRYFWHVLWANKMLFFSVVCGLIAATLISSLPWTWLNRRILKHEQIGGQEIGAAVISTVMFLVCCDVYKAIKRRWYGRKMTKTVV